MPLLGKTARVKISPKIGEYHESTQHQILRWLQENPDACKDTTLTKLSEVIFLPDSNLDKTQIYNVLARLSRKHLIRVSGHKSSPKKQIYLNYVHPQMPLTLISSASEKDLTKSMEQDKEQRAEIKSKTKHITPPKAQTKNKKTENTSLSIPLKASDLTNGLSLTLNINFTITK